MRVRACENPGSFLLMGADDMKKIILAVVVGGFPERSEDLLSGMQISIESAFSHFGKFFNGLEV